MKLLRLAKQQWTVLAVQNDRGNCQVLDLLSESGDPGERLLSDLRESIPARGPPLNNQEFSKSLRDKIFEFREPTTKGGTLRVLWFYDENKLVVCANGVLKKRGDTPAELIDAAVKVRTAYFEAKKVDQLTITDLPSEEE